MKSYKIILFSLVIFISILFSSCFLPKDSQITSSKITNSPLNTIKSSDTTIQNTQNENSSQTSTPKKITGVGKKVSILYYHCVSNNIFGLDELFVSPEEFDKQMNYLSKNDYSIITFDDLPQLESIDNPVIITFDDGYENNYTEAYPILKKYNFKASIFLTVNSINKKNYLKESQILSMSDLINFQSHTLSHPDLRKLSENDIEYEISESIKKIQKLTSQTSNVFAYPVGYYNEKVLNITKKHFDYALTNSGGLYYNNKNNYEIKRVYIPRNLNITNFKEKIKVGKF